MFEKDLINPIEQNDNLILKVAKLIKRDDNQFIEESRAVEILF